MTLWEWVAEAADKTRANGHEQLATALGRLPELAVLGDTHRITIELPAALRAATEPGPRSGPPTMCGTGSSPRVSSTTRQAQWCWTRSPNWCTPPTPIRPTARPAPALP